MKKYKKLIKKHRNKFKNKTLLVVAISVFLILAIFIVSPASSQFSLAKLMADRKATTAPVIDSIKSTYTVVGEANSATILVKYKAGVSEQAKNNINAKNGGTQKKKIQKINVDVVAIANGETVDQTLAKYRADKEVEYAEPNYLAKGLLTPNDTMFSKQWNLQKIEAPKAWDVSQGGYGPIAVVDTGIATNQSDISGSLLSGFNFVNDTSNANDDNGHGTHVAGIISAVTNNGNGVASVGFKGSLIPVKVLDSGGSGTYGDVASGIIFAADRGAKIINMSLGGSSSSSTLKSAVTYAQSKGSLIVAAAGNNGNSSAVYPAAYAGVIAVSATTQDDSLASYSSYGGNIYVSAPGSSIISTYYNGGYATLSGTSMAAPAVSGLIGLALSRGTTTVSGVLNDLKSTSDKVGPYGYDQNGWNQYFGYGRINAARLLGIAPVAPTPSVPTEDSPQSGGSNNSRANTNRSPNSPNYGNNNSGGNSTASPGNSGFTTVLQGTIDGIDLERNVISLKVKSSSQNLPLSADSLIDLYIDGNTVIKSGNIRASLSQLILGMELINIKALWKDNKLLAQEIFYKR